MLITFYHFCYCLSHTSVWLLDVQHLGDGGSDIRNVYLTAGATVLHLPAIEQQGDVGVVGVPLPVGCANRRRRTCPELIPPSLQHQQQVARAVRMIA